MQNKIFRKGLVLGIIVLFIGGSVIPCNSVNVSKKSDMLSTLEDGLVGYWKLDEGSGGTAFDDSGNNNHGILYGPIWVDGISGKALEFNGVDDYVRVNDSDSLDITSGVTIEAWIKLDSWDDAIILDKGWNYRLSVTEDGYICGRMFALGWECHDILGTTQVTLHTWHHVAFTWDESMFRCYLDGVEDNSTLDNFTYMDYLADPLRIGVDNYENAFFNGAIDEIRIYARALNATEIVEHYYNLRWPAVLIKVNSTLLPEIIWSLQIYEADLNREGYRVYIEGFNGTNESQLRNEIKELYDSDRNLIGCLFIGNLPLAWTHSNWPDGPDLPTDYYFMDLDGKWIDEDDDGVYDHHNSTTSGDNGPEIWVGRLYPSTITFDNYNEKTLIQDYFDRNHLFRTGHLDWMENEVPLYFTNCPEGAESSELNALDSLDKYPDAELHECYNDSLAGFTLRSELREGHEFVHITSHGYETGFYMERSFDVTSAHIWKIKPHTLFYNTHSCSTGRFITTNNLGESAIFSTGLVYLGATGLMCYTPEHNNIFVGNLNNHTFGYSYKSVYDYIYTQNPDQDIYWSNMEWVLLGDPTLKLNMSEYFTNDTLPVVTIISPKEKFVYFRNKEIVPFFTTIIIGKIEVEVDAFDNEWEIDRVEFYIDNTLKETYTSKPYIWTWDELAFFRHKIKVKVYDAAGYRTLKEMKVWKFF